MLDAMSFCHNNGESEALAEHCYTELKAAMEGRMRHNEAYACDACKQLFYKPSLKLPDWMPLSRKPNIIFGIFICPLIGY